MHSGVRGSISSFFKVSFAYLAAGRSNGKVAHMYTEALAGVVHSYEAYIVICLSFSF